MSYWVLPPAVRKGSLSRVFRPDCVMGEAAWTREVREANNKTSEKPNVRKEINRRCSTCCCFKGKPPLGIDAFTLHMLAAG